jgi:glucokinase
VSLAIGVDVGGTKVLAGVVDPDGSVRRTVRVATPRLDARALADSIIGAARDAAQGESIACVGISLAALLDADRTRILLAPNGGWASEPLGLMVEQSLGVPTLLENDGNCAAWGEFRFGAGRAFDEVVMVTVGTGVGGGLVLGGLLRRGFHGIGGEIGHLTVVPEGLPCGCGRTGCWEQYASGNALVREARRLALRRRADASLLLSLGDGTPEGVQGVHVTEAARLGDVVALAAFDYVGAWLGRGMADLAAVLDPPVFVLGGGVSAAGDILAVPARCALAQEAMGKGSLPVPAVVVAELGNRAGIVGAADLARAAAALDG